MNRSAGRHFFDNNQALLQDFSLATSKIVAASIHVAPTAPKTPPCLDYSHSY